MVLYDSTRGGCEGLTSAEAIKQGISPNGGLYVPRFFEQISFEEIEALTDKTYNERAVEILKRFLDDFTAEELEDCINQAYTTEKFNSKDIAPLVKLNDSLGILELWHGPTCAFKDMALQILPHFVVKAMKKTGEESEIVILVATSGDTGKAALEGFADVEGTRIIVFYPAEGVSEVQKYQMITQTGNNVKVVGVEGNFDDTQTGVKRIFTDRELIERMEERKLKFSSANSINWPSCSPNCLLFFCLCRYDQVRRNKIRREDKLCCSNRKLRQYSAGFYAKMMGLRLTSLFALQMKIMYLQTLSVPEFMT